MLDEPYGDGPGERLDVYRPQGAGPLPTVVWIHGGGWIGGSKEELANWCRLIAGHGFAVVAVGYSLRPRTGTRRRCARRWPRSRTCRRTPRGSASTPSGSCSPATRRARRSRRRWR